VWLRDGKVARVFPAAACAHARRPVDACASRLVLLFCCSSRVLYAVFRSLLPHLSPRCTLALAGFFVSNVCFVLSALSLFWQDTSLQVWYLLTPACRLGCITLRDGELAERAALLFCFNPASIFYSAVYSESIFALLSFAGALSLAVDSPWAAATAFMAATATRSNGALRLAQPRLFSSQSGPSQAL